jgi:hypothetical protein
LRAAGAALQAAAGAAEALQLASELSGAYPAVVTQASAAVAAAAAAAAAGVGARGVSAAERRQHAFGWQRACSAQLGEAPACFNRSFKQK